MDGISTGKIGIHDVGLFPGSVPILSLVLLTMAGPTTTRLNYTLPRGRSRWYCLDWWDRILGGRPSETVAMFLKSFKLLHLVLLMLLVGGSILLNILKPLKNRVRAEMVSGFIL